MTAFETFLATLPDDGVLALVVTISLWVPVAFAIVVVLTILAAIERRIVRWRGPKPSPIVLHTATRPFMVRFLTTKAPLAPRKRPWRLIIVMVIIVAGAVFTGRRITDLLGLTPPDPTSEVSDQ